MMRKIIRTFIGILLCIFHIYIYVRFVIKLHAFMLLFTNMLTIQSSENRKYCNSELKCMSVVLVIQLGPDGSFPESIHVLQILQVSQLTFPIHSFINDKASHFLVLVRLHFLKIDTCLQHLPVMHSQLLILYIQSFATDSFPIYYVFDKCCIGIITINALNK